MWRKETEIAEIRYEYLQRIKGIMEREVRSGYNKVKGT
jgi:hypothetical protein